VPPGERPAPAATPPASTPEPRAPAAGPPGAGPRAADEPETKPKPEVRAEKPAPPPASAAAPPAAPPETPSAPSPDRSAGPPPEPASWQEITPAHIDQVVFERLPPDAGVVSPIAPADEPLDPDIEAEIEEIRSRLVAWGPGRVAEPVQRVRNLLYVAAVPDVFQLPIERYVPHVVFERIQQDVPHDDLVKILFWIATHPGGGDDSAVDDLRSAGLQVSGPSDIDQARERVMLYSLKLLGRLVGRIQG
jgi:hypothetical protein